MYYLCLYIIKGDSIMRKILFLLLFSLAAFSASLAKDEADNSQYDVCEKVDKGKIASILGWNAAATEVETLSSSSGRSKGVCRYTYQGEELIINIKEKQKDNNYSDDFKAFTSVNGSYVNETGEAIHKMTDYHTKYEIELNYKTTKFTAEAFNLMADITKLIE